ncbi:delta(14)-sterol reductase TM7SF2-like isoform X2 [Amphiura filiformis]|uniref:delta(14)-sterol reductase TM7SF2-like isoform X2 n=1 Tax=Amphiura filiformis TaxID=82378 RepID=UPI003B2119A2
MKGLQTGEKVMAKWPGSALWFPALVTAIDEDSYEVKFEDGTKNDLEERNVTRESSFRRRSRSRSPARKSPTRRRSRSPGRKESPTRKSSRSPGRKPSTKAAKETKTTPTRTASKPKTTPTRTSTRTTEVSTAQSDVKRTVTRTETYSRRSASRSGVQILESPVDIKQFRVPKTACYDREFPGPIGVLVVILVLPIHAFYLYFACNEKNCAFAFPTVISLDWFDYYDITAYGIVVGWMVFQFILHMIPIGRVVRGAPLRTGECLKYRLNGIINGVFCIGLLLTMIYFKCGVTIIFDKFLPLMAGAVLTSLILSVILYILALFAPGHAISPKGNTENILYDFFAGHELNPRPWDVDMKLYNYRTALIAWACIDISFLVVAWTDFPDNPPYSLVCVVFFQLVFIFDNLFFEEFFLTSTDTQYGGLGFSGTYDFLVYLPFVYSLPARYLVSHHPANMPQYCLIPIIIFSLVGWIIYRQSNTMRSYFRRNPNAKETKELARLLMAGWWRFVLRPSYLGDIMTALSWSLFCGFDSALPYFYPVWLTLSLIQWDREYRRACKAKYGPAWDPCCMEVPYRLIPYIYSSSGHILRGLSYSSEVRVPNLQKVAIKKFYDTPTTTDTPYPLNRLKLY